MKFAKLVFLAGGIYGLAVVTPLYVLRPFVERLMPPAITHPEFYFAFVGAVVVWHVLFVVMSKDPVRYRPLMPVAALEKVAFGGPTLALALSGAASKLWIPGALIDLFLGALFIAAFVKLSVPVTSAAAARTS